MKHKTSELTGALLDAAVALAEGWVYAEKNVWLPPGRVGQRPRIIGGTGCFAWAPSSVRDHGGPIIDRERIAIWAGHGCWHATPCTSVGYDGDSSYIDVNDDDSYSGPTPLIAAMRAYVASKLGDEVELP